ncbi:non-hydrolyzing UDP-N-acetylglucosamine 2-epimerase [Candidatus Lokiarchaeum ossiferum]
MTKIKICLITGTRPELIKVSVLLKLMKKDPQIQLTFIHSGQHYDELMFGSFLRDLNLPNPDYNIEVGSLPNSVQTGKMLISLNDIIYRIVPDLILAQGDTNTVLAAALTSFKNNIPFGHIEAGIRSFDMRMPEEINRVLTGSCALLNFAPTQLSVNNLIDNGILPNRIFLVGNPIVDAVHENIEIANKKSKIDQNLEIESGKKFVLLTMHRPSNVDNRENLKNIIETLLQNKEILYIFPAHPRTVKNIKKFNLYEEIQTSKNIRMIEPVNYFDMLKLMNLSSFILTDSGGLQEEAVILKKPCITLRENTERPESIEVGANILVGTDMQKLKSVSTNLWTNKVFYKSMIPHENPFGDGNSSKKMIQIIKDAHQKGKLQIPFIEFKNTIPHCKLIDTSSLDEDLITVSDFEKEKSCIILEIFDYEGNSIFPSPNLEITKKMKLKARFI